MLIWLAAAVPNFANSYNVGSWLSFVLGVLLLVDFGTHFWAYATCQPVICSQLIGGDGRETMNLYVAERGRLGRWFGSGVGRGRDPISERV